MCRLQVHEAFYSFVNPTSTGGTAKLAMLSTEVAALLGLDPTDCQTEEFAAAMSGNAQLPGREGCARLACHDVSCALRYRLSVICSRPVS